MEMVLPWCVTAIALLVAAIAVLRSGGEGRLVMQEAANHRAHLAEVERALAARVEQMRLEQQHVSEKLTYTLGQGQSSFQLLLSEKLCEMAERQNQQVMQLRSSVEEHLHGAVEKQMHSSFQRVVEQFATMQKALGEVQGMTAQMNDFKRLFANIKTRGGWGEAQCRAILDDILPEGSYERDCRLSHQSGEVVEFAVKMPVRMRNGAKPPLLAIDSKFPTVAYERLLLAAEEGNGEAERVARRDLEKIIKSEAAKISSKYIRPPETVEFAVLYLPTDGLYAEIARIPGIIDTIGREYRVLVMGPSLLPALLRTVHLGYVTLALEERTDGIAKLLGETRREMLKMDQVLEKLQRNAGTMGNTIEEVRRRTRVLGRRLNALEEAEALSKECEEEKEVALV